MDPRRVILVTGASSGIGAAIARRLHGDGGVSLVLVARRKERLQRLGEALGATTIAIDITATEAPAVIAQRVENEHGRLDVLVNNAGAHWSGTFADTGWEAVRASMDLNFNAHVRLTETLLPLLRLSAPSAVVNIGSVAGRVGLFGSGAYSAAKFAMCGWSEALHAEERGNGVHVSLILPGFVETEGFKHRELKASFVWRWTVASEVKVAKAVIASLNRRTTERYVPRFWRLLPTGARMTPGLYGRRKATIRA